MDKIESPKDLTWHRRQQARKDVEVAREVLTAVQDELDWARAVYQAALDAEVLAVQADIDAWKAG